MEPSSPPTNIKALNQNGNLNNRGTYQQVLLNNTGSPKPSTPQSHSKQSNKQQNKQSSSTPLGSVAGMKYSPPSSSGRKVSPILPNSNDPPNSPPPPPIIVVGEEDLNLSSCSDNEIVNPALVQNLHNGIQASDSSSTTSNNEEEISFTSPLYKQAQPIINICGQPGLPGFQNGDIIEARFSDIQGILMLPKDDFIGDSSFVVAEQHQIRLVNMKQMNVSTFYSTQLHSPRGMAIYKGSILVCDSQQHKIKMISLDGRRMTTFAGTGHRGCSIGRVSDVLFDTPTAVCVVGENVFVADTGNHRIVRINNGFASNAAGTPKTPGFLDGKVQNTLLNSPTDIIAKDNVLYVNDFGNFRIRQLFTNYSDMRTVIESTEKIYAMSVNSDGELVLGTHNTLYKYNLETKESSSILCETPEPIKKVICASRNMYLVACANSIHGVEDQKPSTNISTSMLDLKHLSRKLKATQNFSFNASIQESWNNESTFQKPSYFELIYCYEQDLLEIFSYYCNNVTHTFMDVNEMTSNQFLRLAKDCKIVDKTFNSNAVFLIYEESTKYSPTFKMNFDDFLNALAFIAIRKYSKIQINNISDMAKHDDDVKVLLRKLLFEHVLPNSGKLIQDPTPSELSDPSVNSLWSAQQDHLYKIFMYYTQKKRSHKETLQWVHYNKGLHTLNVDEFFMFCSDFEIFPQFFSKIQLAGMFTSCCKTHNEHISEHASKEGRLMTFVEFLECLGRIALAKYSESPLCDVYKTPRQKIEGLLEHMHLSEGRKFFAAQLGNRLFNNVESPMKKQLVQQMKQSYLGRNPQRSKLQYSDFSFAKQKLKDKDSIDISLRRMAEEQEHSETKCNAKDVVLYLASKSDDETSWKFITSGELSLSFSNVLSFVDQEGNCLFKIPLSSDGLPVIEEKELFHIFRDGVLVDDQSIYAIQFSSKASSDTFEKEYETIVQEEKRNVFTSSPFKNVSLLVPNVSTPKKSKDLLKVPSTSSSSSGVVNTPNKSVVSGGASNNSTQRSQPRSQTRPEKNSPMRSQSGVSPIAMLAHNSNRIALPSSSPLLTSHLHRTPPSNNTPGNNSKISLSPSKSLSDLSSSDMNALLTSKQQLPSTLHREMGILTVQGMTLNKGDCSTWSSHDIRKLLTTPKTNGGVGLVAEQIADFTLYGSDFETIVDALVRFEGDDEAKIEHACTQIFVDNLSMRIRQPIVRWIFQTLLKKV
ncbi:hypothetical protein FDP41_012531 [Naegleria fowleri]|uniref:Uncharacterized protein n=1 Tax=Naegleria fowleri TaxID=5763 RepID=A0A6A5C2L5_NAEFO|nr:uncharacterized protein FDP41_012531 [Naegleria fowleri]KAF0981271.1 hypothetical protein FDP41_012531 [Naegleria fowleri]